MSLRTYQAATMAEALAKVKSDMGRDAVILHTRSFRKGALLGFLGGRSMWEITAAPNVNVLSRQQRMRYVPAQSAGQSRKASAEAAPVGADASTATATIAAPAPAAKSSTAAGTAEHVGSHIGAKIGQIQDMVQALLEMQGRGESCLAGPLRPLHSHLLSQDVDDAVAAELMTRLQNEMTGRQLAQPSLVRNRLVELISQRVTTVAPHEWQSGKCRIISLIGPTGVGKTTTIAKLAASFKLRQGMKVGLITIDTYRIAAVDQLKTYAQIIEVPLRVVLSADELKTAIGEMQDLDVLLIDTAGRSQNDQPRLNQLRGFLDAACPDEVHLVVSATANRHCARATVEKFMPLGVGRVIVTKLDEAACFGTMLNIPIAGNVALSYVTTGQDVPDDIALADPRRLADCIIEGRLQ